MIPSGSLKFRTFAYMYMMASQLVVRYSSEPTIRLYIFSSTSFLGSSFSSHVEELIRVPKVFPFLSPNFFISSFMYLVWLMKVTLVDCLICSPKKKVSSPIKFILNSSFRRLAKFSQRLALKLPKIMSST